MAFLIRNRRLFITASILASLLIIFDLVALWHEAGPTTSAQLLRGNFICFSGFACKPFPRLLTQVFGSSLFLAALALLPLFLFAHAPLSRLHLALRIIIGLLVVLPISAFFSVASGYFMPLIWLPVVHDYLLGLPVSVFAISGSWAFVFPATAITMILGIVNITRLSKQHDHDTNAPATRAA